MIRGQEDGRYKRIGRFDHKDMVNINPEGFLESRNSLEPWLMAWEMTVVKEITLKLQDRRDADRRLYKPPLRKKHKGEIPRESQIPMLEEVRQDYLTKVSKSSVFEHVDN